MYVIEYIDYSNHHYLDKAILDLSDIGVTRFIIRVPMNLPKYSLTHIDFRCKHFSRHFRIEEILFRAIDDDSNVRTLEEINVPPTAIDVYVDNFINPVVYLIRNAKYKLDLSPLANIVLTNLAEHLDTVRLLTPPKKSKFSFRKLWSFFKKEKTYYSTDSQYNLSTALNKFTTRLDATLSFHLTHRADPGYEYQYYQKKEK